MAQMAQMAFMVMADGSTNMAIIYIQLKGIENKLKYVVFISIGHSSKVMTISIFWIKFIL